MSDRPHFITRATYHQGGLNVRFLTASYRYLKVPYELGTKVAALTGQELINAFDTLIEGKFKSERI
jgi:hypothetical protein